MPVAYFDADGVCVAVSELPLMVPEGGCTAIVSRGVTPNMIYCDGGKAASAEPLALDIPERVDMPGDDLSLPLPPGVIAYVDGERQTGQLVVQADSERDVSISIRGRMTGTACVKVQTYASRRREAYPSVGDQLDAIWKALAQSDVSPPDMLAQIQAIKDAYPKPEEAE